MRTRLYHVAAVWPIVLYLTAGLQFSEPNPFLWDVSLRVLFSVFAILLPFGIAATDYVFHGLPTKPQQNDNQGTDTNA